MFRARYLLSDVARLLRRSESSLLLDAKLGLLKIRASSASRTKSGANEVYAVTLGDLVRYMGKDKAYSVFGSSTHARKLAPEDAFPHKPSVEAKYKKCRICGRLKPISDFPREAGSTHWLAAECNTCKELYKL
jgi:hypothetical protein